MPPACWSKLDTVTSGSHCPASVNLKRLKPIRSYSMKNHDGLRRYLRIIYLTLIGSGNTHGGRRKVLKYSERIPTSIESKILRIYYTYNFTMMCVFFSLVRKYDFDQ